MAEELLSAAELESLLAAFAAEMAPPAAASEPSRSAPASPPPAPAAKPRPRSTDHWVSHDWKRPQRTPPEMLAALQTLHSPFGRNFAAALSALTRSVVEVRLTSVDQLAYDDFVFGLESPTCFNVVRAAPLEQRWALDLSPAILYPIIDRLLGGGREPAPITRRPLTEIELRLAARVTGAFLQALRSAWASVIELDLAVERVESQPRSAPIVTPHEAVVAIGFEVSIGGHAGLANLCIPLHALEALREKLDARPRAATPQAPTEDSRQQIGQELHHAVVELEVRLAEAKISTIDALNLRVGDIIATEKDVRSPLEVCVAGQPKFQAQPGAFKGRKAVQIELALPDASPPPTSAVNANRGK